MNPVKIPRVAVVRPEPFLAHWIGSPHPENPARLQAISELFEQSSSFSGIFSLPLIQPRPQWLFASHARELVESLTQLEEETGWIDPDTYYGPKSVETALVAAGMTADLAVRIWKGEWDRGFSFVRPPGHHATSERSMGFCLLNNVAIAAHAVLEQSPQARIAIIDFDLHHGNGTQEIFYSNPNVLFISSHRYPYYPGTGGLDEVGEGRGKGTKVNLPLGNPYGDGLFCALYGEIVSGMLAKFRPEMVFVSAGFDGHVDDPMQGFQIHTDTYGYIAEKLIESAERTSGKILFVLEGGYNPLALKECSKVVLDKLLKPVAPPEHAIPLTAAEHRELESFQKFFRDFV